MLSVVNTNSNLKNQKSVAMMKKSNDESTAKKTNNIRVVVRIRPSSTSQPAVTALPSSLNEIINDEQEAPASQLVQVAATEGSMEQPRWFELDGVFSSDSTQKQLYIQSGARSAIVDDLFFGYNTTILAYGQTGA
jgi:hypothetical protein